MSLFRAARVLTASAVLLAVPGEAAWAQVSRVALPSRGLAPLSAPAVRIDAPSVSLAPSLAAPSLAVSLAPAPAAAALFVAAPVAALAVPAAPRALAVPARPAAARAVPEAAAPAEAKAPAETMAAAQNAAFDGASAAGEIEDAPAVAAAGFSPSRSLAPSRRAAAPAALAGLMPLAVSMPSSAYEWHVLAGMTFGAVAFVYALTGTISLLTPVLKRRLEPALPAVPEVVVDAGQFPLPPAKAAEALTAEESAALKPGMPRLRSAAGSPQRRWYEFETADGRRIDVHARTGRRMISPRSAVFARGQVNRWLAGTRWKAAGPARLVTVQGEYYRKGELPHYEVDVEGPGGWRAYVSAKDGRILEAHSRAARTLKWIGKGPHAWGIKALDKVDTLKRLLAPFILGLPILSLAVTAFWLKMSRGFPIELPGLSDGAWAWHKFFGSWSLFVLLYMGITGPLTLFMPIATKKLTPKLPKGESLGAEAFVLSPAEAARFVPAGPAPVNASARSSRRRAWYEFELADGSRRAVSAADGSEVPVFMSAAEVEAEAREWLAGSAWTPKPGAVFLDSHDSHYRDFREAEVPVYKLELDGPGGLRVYVSARDGRPTASGMAVRSRLSRFLGTFVKSVHALEWGSFERYPALRRAVMILFLTLPVALTVILAAVARL